MKNIESLNVSDLNLVNKNQEIIENKLNSIIIQFNELKEEFKKIPIGASVSSLSDLKLKLNNLEIKLNNIIGE